MREGDEVPLALGKPVASLRIRVMAIGGALGGLAGALFAHYNAYIAPEYFLPLETFIVWAMVILGGAGNFLGVPRRHRHHPWRSTTRRASSRRSSTSTPGCWGRCAWSRIAVLIILVIIYLPRGIVPERRRRYGR